MTPPPVWTDERLRTCIGASNRARGFIENLPKTSADLAEIDNNAIDVLTNPHLLEALRSAAGPPLSADDLKTLSEAVLSPGRLRQDSAMAHRIVEVVRMGLDRQRFPWILENREPSAHVGQVGNLRAGCQPALRRVSLGVFAKRVDPRPIPTLNHAPNPGKFCRESLLGSRKADIVLRLRDHRIVPIECKVSNSALNSIKRVNNDAAVKAEVWLKDFGTRNIVPAAVLSAVYKLRHLSQAQNRGLTNA
jgi:XamI restriction endonuclease